MLLSRFPRTRLAHLPTPLEFAPRLTAALGGPDIWIKRDDCTGLGTGGNKTRKLEFLVGEALAQGADTLVTQGAVQSNHVRQTAAAAAKVGLACEVLLERRVPGTPGDYERTGNVLLDRLFGATIHVLDSAPADMNAEAERHGETLRARGRKPYVIPGGGSNPTGALGYVLCAFEIVAQANDLDLVVDRIVHGTGSTGTQAGLLAGLAATSAPIPLLGVSVRRPRAPQEDAVHALTLATLDKLGVAAGCARERVVVDDRFVGPGYGQPTPEMVEALRLAARTEGLLFDPVYSGKALAGLVALCREGAFRKGETIVFIHTGGQASLPAYEAVLAAE